MKKMTHIAVCLIAAFSIFLPHMSYAATDQDPFESYNRRAFTFNRFLDRFIFKPAATAYDKVLPDPVKKRVSNFFGNLDTVPTIANDLLQAKFEHAISDTLRLSINSTVGFLGFFDPATNIGFTRHEEDFGLTLASWGYQDSAFLVVPFFGPRTVRDAFSIPVDYGLLSVYPYVKPRAAAYGALALRFISNRAQLLRLESVIDEAALDRYVFERNAYLQHRAYVMKQNS